MVGAIAVTGALTAAGLPAAKASAVGTPPEVTVSITASKKNVRPGQPVTFTITATHPTAVALYYPGVQPWPLWRSDYPGITDNTCNAWDTSRPGEQSCHFTVVPNLAKGETRVIRFTALQRWAEAPHGILSREVEASTTIRGVGGKR